MSTTKGHSNIAGTAVEFAPGLWRTNLQRGRKRAEGRAVTARRSPSSVWQEA